MIVRSPRSIVVVTMRQRCRGPMVTPPGPPPAENLRVIADRAMAMAAFYQPELTNRDTGEKTAVPFGFSKIERIAFLK